MVGQYNCCLRDLRNLRRLKEYLSKVVVPFHIPIGSVGEFQLLHILVNIWCCQYLYSNQCVVVAHCFFNLHFPDDV